MINLFPIFLAGRNEGIFPDSPHVPLGPRLLTWHLRGLEWISAAGVRLGSAWNCLYQTLFLTPVKEREAQFKRAQGWKWRLAHACEHKGGQQLRLLGWWEYRVGVHSPRVGLAAGPGGGGILEVPCLTGNTVSLSLPDFIWQEKSKASQGEWARGVSPRCEFPLFPLNGPPCP